MTAEDPDKHTRDLAADSFAENDPTAWFDRLYTQANEGEATVPWDHEQPQQLLVDWVDQHHVSGDGQRALVIGAGLGRDAEYLASLGFDTTAFDVSGTAVETARHRHPNSTVDYRVANLLELPAGWLYSFDFVFESLTVQSLPEPPRHEAIARVRSLLRPGGILLVVANARGEQEGADGPPWPLTPTEVELFGDDSVTEISRERVPDENDPAIHRWRVVYQRASTETAE